MAKTFKTIMNTFLVLVLLMANLPMSGAATSSWERAENGMLLSGTTLVHANADAAVYMIPEGVTAIGPAAFYGMDQLTEAYTEQQLQHLTDIFLACSRYELAFWDMAWTCNA